MPYILFATYLIFFAWLVTKVKFFRRSELSSSQLFILFLAKVGAGIFYGWIGLHYANTAQASDTWGLFWESLKEHHTLLNDPGEFFSSLFRSPYDSGYGNFLSVSNSWWNDVKSNAFVKILAILNVFSFKNYYVTLILYSFITFFGAVAFYRVMKDVFPLQRIPVLLGCFFLPSFIYWASGLHRDGLIFTSIALIVYHVYFGIRNRRIHAAGIIIIILSLIVILLLRNFIIVPLMPALLVLVLSHKLPFKPLHVFLGAYLLFAIVFFTAKYIHPSLDFPQSVMSRQESFNNLAGDSKVSVEKLDPTVFGFARLLPQAFYLAMLRPTFSDVSHLLSLAACAEVYLYVLLFAVFLLYRLKDLHPDLRFILFALFFGFTVLLLIGFTVNNLGAIVRYRSIILPFIIAPMMAMINWQRLGKATLNI